MAAVRATLFAALAFGSSEGVLLRRQLNVAHNSTNASGGNATNESASDKLQDQFMDRVEASVNRTVTKAERQLAEADLAQAKANHTLATVDGNQTIINATKEAINATKKDVNATAEAHRAAREEHREEREEHREAKEAYKEGECTTNTSPKYDEVCPPIKDAKECDSYSPHCFWEPAKVPKKEE
eukprot:TRINITY_DN24228_c0_g1_i1.p2 TRINITY_DN24228_c0_g1~~TRINITY_DN24228_c0_g1_i1.p2  ORF type:complete len:184 (+),score=64.00 TRINITY_DN24228_c0_g1_i1:64-615(+)